MTAYFKISNYVAMHLGREVLVPRSEEVEAQLEAQQRRGVKVVVVVATVPLPTFDPSPPLTPSPPSTRSPPTSTPTAAASPTSHLHRAPTSLQSELGRVGLLARPSSAGPWSSTSALSNTRSRRATHFPFAIATSFSTFGLSRCFPPPAHIGAQPLPTTHLARPGLPADEHHHGGGTCASTSSRVRSGLG